MEVEGVNKNKLIVAGAGLVAIIAAVLVIGSMNSGNSSSSNSGSKTSQTSKTKNVDACAVLSPATASEILGEKVEKDEGGHHEASTSSLSVTSCSYATAFVVGQADSIKTASLLARAAKDGDGANSNQAQFKSPPSGSQSVSGYGDSAYWDPTYGQLNILKNNNWYILAFGSANLKNRTLEGTKPLADKLISQL